MTSSEPTLERAMPHYAALDVSNEETAIHVVDEAGRTVWRGKRASDPEALATALRRHAPDLVRVGLETGFLTPWLYHGLQALGLPVVCLEARHARAATALQRNKTDANDAETLAHLVRTGWYREARVKSFAAHAVRHLVGARAQLKGVSVDLSNQIRSILKTFRSQGRQRSGPPVCAPRAGTPEGASLALRHHRSAACGLAGGARADRRARPAADWPRQGGSDLPPIDDLPGCGRDRRHELCGFDRSP